MRTSKLWRTNSSCRATSLLKKVGRALLPVGFQAERRARVPVLQGFSTGCYGFPIGLLRLCVLAVTESDKPDGKPDGKPYVREEDQYRLERPGVLAMREYVPGASFFVGNKVVTSHGLLKHWTGANLNTAIGFRGQMAECVNGHRFYSFNADLGPCSVCGAAERKREPQPLLFALPVGGATGLQ